MVTPASHYTIRETSDYLKKEAPTVEQSLAKAISTLQSETGDSHIPEDVKDLSTGHLKQLLNEANQLDQEIRNMGESPQQILKMLHLNTKLEELHKAQSQLATKINSIGGRVFKNEISFGVGREIKIKSLSHLNEANAYELQDIATDEEKVALGAYNPAIIATLGITDQGKLFELLKKLASDANHADVFGKHIGTYGIKEQNKLFEIAKIALAHNPKSAAASLFRYGFTGNNYCFVLSKLALNAGQYPGAEFLRNVKNADHLLELAKLGAQHGNFQLIEEGRITDPTLVLDVFEAARGHLEKPQQEFLDWFKGYFMKLKNPEQQQYNRLWLARYINEKALFADPIACKTMKLAVQTTNINAKMAITDRLKQLFEPDSAEKKERWTQLLKTSQNESLPDHLLPISLSLTELATSENIDAIKVLLSHLTPNYYATSDTLSLVEELALKLNSVGINQKQKLAILNLILKPPEKGAREKANLYVKKLTQFRNDQYKFVAAARDLINMGSGKLLESVTQTDDLLNLWSKESQRLFGLDADLTERFKTTFLGSKRYPGALVSYAARLQELQDSEKEPLRPLLKEFAQAVLDGTFPKLRYDLNRNPHLKKIAEQSPGVIEKWKQPIVFNHKKFTVTDTEQWEDLLLLGTEVENSCQNINREAYLNRCLLAYIHDGKNRPIVVKSGDRIVARAVMRILWDEKKESPVLFLENTYTSSGDPEIRQLIREGALAKAQAMGLPLLCDRVDQDEGSKDYDGPLQSLGGPAPYEYVDALKGAQQNGEFTIPNSKVLFRPSPLTHIQVKTSGG